MPSIMALHLCRFSLGEQAPQVGQVLIEDSSPIRVRDLSASGMAPSLTDLLENPQMLQACLAHEALPIHALEDVTLWSPAEDQEIWAAGVTYFRSKTARMEESDFSATAYDRVYEAPRPEIFFKALAHKTVRTKDPVGIRKDATWNVPEPELALVFTSKGRLAGYTVGNDMSSRDIEGENLLYLPQAKVYDRSCALGPWITLADSEEEARSWTIQLLIVRKGSTVFEGQTEVAQMKRSFSELQDYLFRSQTFPAGAILLTGTGLVPEEGFTLQAEDRVDITISGIGTLSNTVVEV